MSMRRLTVTAPANVLDGLGLHPGAGRRPALALQVLDRMVEDAVDRVTLRLTGPGWRLLLACAPRMRSWIAADDRPWIRLADAVERACRDASFAARFLGPAPDDRSQAVLGVLRSLPASDAWAVCWVLSEAWAYPEALDDQARWWTGAWRRARAEQVDGGSDGDGGDDGIGPGEPERLGPALPPPPSDVLRPRPD
jgi:hypothetical protein